MLLLLVGASAGCKDRQGTPEGAVKEFMAAINSRGCQAHAGMPAACYAGHVPENRGVSDGIDLPGIREPLDIAEVSARFDGVPIDGDWAAVSCTFSDGSREGDGALLPDRRKMVSNAYWRELCGGRLTFPLAGLFSVPIRQDQKGVGIMKKSVALVAALLLLAGVLAGCGDSQSTPEGVLKKFYNALNNMDAKSLMECFTPETQTKIKLFYGNIDMSDFAKLKESMGMSSDEKITVKINGVQMNGDAAIIDTTVSFGDVTEKETAFRCIKVDGKWYCDID